MPNPTNGTLDPAALRRDLDALGRDTGRQFLWADEFTDDLFAMVIALEEALAAPWWRRRAALAAWRRDIRASVRHVDGHDFTGRRVTTIGTGWVTGPGSKWAASGAPR